MNEDKKLDETEQIFSEYFAVLDKSKIVKNNTAMPQSAIIIEYMQLAESFEKLLKLSVRISKLGDKAQNKLMKYKQMLDTMRNMD